MIKQSVILLFAIKNVTGRNEKILHEDIVARNNQSQKQHLLLQHFYNIK
jgi:hypothetical protein